MLLKTTSVSFNSSSMDLLWEEIGFPTSMLINPGLILHLLIGLILNKPLVIIGKIDAPVLTAKWKPPFLNAPKEPSCVLVPSGKITIW